jgi:hypothetical protein
MNTASRRAEGGARERQPQRRLLDRAVQHRGPDAAAPGMAARRQQHREHGHHGRQSQHTRHHRRGQHTHQAQALTPGHDAAALALIAAQHRAPGLVRHGHGAERGVGQRQRRCCPGQRRTHALYLREKHQRKADRQHQRGARAKDQHRARRSLVQAVHPAADQRVDEGVEQARRQQHSAQQWRVARQIRARSDWARTHTAAARQRPGAGPAARSARRSWR